MNIKSLNSEGGHLVFDFDVELPLSCRIEHDTGRLILDTPTIEIGGQGEAGVLRLSFSPEAINSLLHLLRELEEMHGVTIGRPPTAKIQ